MGDLIGLLIKILFLNIIYMELSSHPLPLGDLQEQKYQNRYQGLQNSGDRWKRTKNLGLSIFITKAYEILQNNHYNEIICWNEQGTSFTITDVDKFQSIVLPIYFRHRNFSSFVRQLNMYDFHKIRNEKNLNMFEHKDFRRGAKQLLYKIKRKGCLKKQNTFEEEESEEKQLIKPRNRMRELPQQNNSKKQLLDEFINTLPQILQTEQEIEDKIKQLKHNPKYKCLNSREDIRNIYKKLKHRKILHKGELEELSIEQQIIVHNNLDQEILGVPSLAIFSSDKYLPFRSVSLIPSINHYDEIQNIFYYPHHN